jgi:hypothetical protein
MEYYKNLSLELIRYQDLKGVWCVEEFLDIPGYEGMYQVSDLGRIKNIMSNNSKKGKTLKPEIAKKGYLKVTLYKNKTRKHFQIHRLVATVFIPNPENKPQVNHKNGIKDDNIESNIEWSTESENVRHAFDNGLNYALKGEKNGYSKLSNEDVLKIRSSSKTGVYLSKEFKVSCAHISRIRLNQVWNHV